MTAVIYKTYNNPEVWNTLLESFRGLYGDAVIAGGCVRDYVHDQQTPKDIDIFVPVEDDFDFDMQFWNLPDPFQGRRYATKDNYGGASAFANVSGVAIIDVQLTFSNEGLPDQVFNVELNLIGKPREKIADPSLLMEDFDHSLCQFWWDGRRVLRTSAARETMKTNEIKVLRKGPRTLQRLDKLVYRPGYEKYRDKHFEQFRGAVQGNFLKPNETQFFTNTITWADANVNDWIVPANNIPGAWLNR